MAVLLQAKKIEQAFGVTSQQAAHKASHLISEPSAVVSVSQHEATSDLLQRLLAL